MHKIVVIKQMTLSYDRLFLNAHMQILFRSQNP